MGLRRRPEAGVVPPAAALCSLVRFLSPSFTSSPPCSLTVVRQLDRLFTQTQDYIHRRGRRNGVANVLDSVHSQSPPREMASSFGSLNGWSPQGFAAGMDRAVSEPPDLSPTPVQRHSATRGFSVAAPPTADNLDHDFRRFRVSE